MKIIALGDTHGRSYWKEIAETRDFDKLIFIGDYFDSKEDIGPQKQIANFNDIIRYKELQPEKVILLLGNHDFHYLDWTDEIYTGYQPAYYDKFSSLLHAALREQLIQMCFLYRRILFTHAGVTGTWCKRNQIDIQDIESSINVMFLSSPSIFEYASALDDDGNLKDTWMSPIWVRPAGLFMDGLNDFIQVVGHTMQARLRLIEDIAFIDTLGTSREYLCIDGDTMAPGNLGAFI